MNKSTKFLIAILLIAVIFLSIAAGCFFLSRAGGQPAEPASSCTVSSAQTESAEGTGNGNSSKSGADAVELEGGVTGLRCSVQLGTLNIVEGEAFHVSAGNGSDYEAYIENGTYIVNGSRTYDNHIVVTVPKEFQFETVELVAAGGALTAENLNTQNLYTNCNRGTINYSGSASAGAEIQQLQGKTVLTMDGRQADYNYSLDLDLGHIGIGDQEYAGPHQDQSIDNSAEKTIDASCTMGSIRILFSQAS